MMSAPMPSMRFAVSVSRPQVSPTISTTSATSTATARTPISVRSGPVQQVAHNHLTHHGCFSLRGIAHVHQFRSRGLLELEAIRSGRLHSSTILVICKSSR